jgi:mono/diheme cytochrome c family protein
MSTRDWHRRLVLPAVALLLFASVRARAETPNLGRPVAPEDLAAWDISIPPDGAGLPPGSGTPAQGEAIYAAACQNCHGERGAGKPNDALAGGKGTLTGDIMPVKTVGSFWPYATTLFDYVRRAMPLNAPKSLTDDQVYAVSAYVLRLNGIIDENDTMDARTLPAVRMPNRDGFILFTRGR